MNRSNLQIMSVIQKAENNQYQMKESMEIRGHTLGQHESIRT